MVKLDMTRSDHDLIETNFYSLGALGAKNAPVDLYDVFDHVWRTVAAFLLALGAYVLRHTWWQAAVCVVLLTILVVSMTFRFVAVIIDSVMRTMLEEAKPHLRRKNVIFKLWWPFWTVVLILGGTAIGATLGKVLWFHSLKRYWDIHALQRYSDIDTDVVSGDRIADVGLISFEEGTSIDRAAGGCFLNAGHTYCVAPILKGGQIQSQLGDMPRTGTYDFFAVGIDCCTCPNQDFRCGDAWASPTARGGLRMTDDSLLPFYTLAADDWAAEYEKASRHPLFFEWVRAPLPTYHNLWGWAASITALAVCTFVSVATGIALVLGKILKLMIAKGLVADERQETLVIHACTAPGMGPGMGRAWQTPTGPPSMPGAPGGGPPFGGPQLGQQRPMDGYGSVGFQPGLPGGMPLAVR